MQTKAPDATSVICLIRFTLEPYNFALNTFQDFVLTYFKQERQCLCNYRLLKLLLDLTKLKNNTECLCYFRMQKYRPCILVEKVLPEHQKVIFDLIYCVENLEKSIHIVVLVLNM